MNLEIASQQVLCEIARSAFTVVDHLLARDQLLAWELRSDTTTSRQVYREECITVEMAATLRERFPRNVEITLFTPREETQTGADWYWRFERRDRAIHARVQAKRVQRNEFRQEDRDGRVVIDLPQLEQLIEATHAASPQLPGLQAWFATFARFNAQPPCGCDDLQDCSRHGHGTPCAYVTPSLWIAQASEIRELRNSRLSVEAPVNESVRLPVGTVVRESVRLDCILPCIDGPGKMESPKEGPAAKGFKLADGLPSYQVCIDVIQKDPALLKSFRGALRIFV